MIVGAEAEEELPAEATEAIEALIRQINGGRLRASHKYRHAVTLKFNGPGNARVLRRLTVRSIVPRT